MIAMRLLLASLVVSLGAVPATAASIDIFATTRGYYRDDAGTFLGIGDPVGSYTVGRSGSVWRNYFVFALPALPTVAAARLTLANPPLVFDPSTSFPGFISDVAATEDYELRAIAAPISTLLDPGADQSDAPAIFASIAGGALYGNAVLSDRDSFSIPLGAAALAALNGGAAYFALGGLVTSLTANPADNQSAFAFSGVFGLPEHVTLTLTVAAVPEPAQVGLLVLVLGTAGLAAFRRRPQGAAQD